MHRVAVILVVALCGLFVQAQGGEKVADVMAEHRKADILRKADGLLGERYRPPTGQSLRLFDEEEEWGPPDAVLYWHGTSHVVELVFATDGSLARAELFPEALLHSDSWSDVPERLELLTSQKQWLVDTANQLQPVGRPVMISADMGFCFQSAANLYCSDMYDRASVGHTWREEFSEGFTVEKDSLKSVTVAYKQSVAGVVSGLKPIEGDERELRIGNMWYRIDKDDNESLFKQVALGSFVHLTTYGCAGNEKACDASLTPSFTVEQGLSSSH